MQRKHYQREEAMGNIKLNVYMPERYKDLQMVCKTKDHKKDFMQVHEQPSMASCFGFLELQKQSVTVKLFDEIIIDAAGQRIRTNKDNVTADYHDVHSNGFAQKHNINIVKISQPVYFETTEPVHFILTQTPFYSHGFQIPSAIIRYDVHALQGNCFIYIPTDNPGQTKINFGTPLFHLVPLSNRRLTLNYFYDDNLFATKQKAAVRPSVLMSFMKLLKYKAGL